MKKLENEMASLHEKVKRLEGEVTGLEKGLRALATGMSIVLPEDGSETRASQRVAGGAPSTFTEPDYAPAHDHGCLAACSSNLKNSGMALEMYSTDNSGRYPWRLGDLTPNYLATIPTCPAAGVDTFSGTFRSASNPDLYTVICAGQHHAPVGLPANYPQYASVQGLRQRP